MVCATSIIAANAQFCRRCDQSISGRNMRYSSALRIVQNEEYLSQADLSVLRLKKRSPQYTPYTPSPLMNSYASSTDYNFIPHYALIAGLLAALAFAARDPCRDQETIIGKHQFLGFMHAYFMPQFSGESKPQSGYILLDTWQKNVLLIQWNIFFAFMEPLL